MIPLTDCATQKLSTSTCKLEPNGCTTVTGLEMMAFTLPPLMLTEPALILTRRLPDPSRTSAELPAKMETFPPITSPEGAVPKLVGAPVSKVLSHSVTFVGRGFGMVTFDPTIGKIWAVPDI